MSGAKTDDPAQNGVAIAEETGGNYR